MSKGIRSYAEAGYAAVAIATSDEDRSISSVLRILKDHPDSDIVKDTFWRISATGGLKQASLDDRVNNVAVVDAGLAFAGAFAKLAQSQKTVLFVLDFQHMIKNAVAYRALRDCLNQVKARGCIIVLVAPGWQLPAELEHDIPVIHDALPSREELNGSLQVCIDSLGLEVDEETRGLLLDAASGLTLAEAEGAIAMSYKNVNGKAQLVPESVADEKMKLVKQSGYLEVSTPAAVDDLGGLGGLRNYIEEEIITTLHDPKLRVRGILLCGIPGTGKSLAAKVLAAKLRRPILRMDIGALKNSKVGDSERAMREALKLAEAVSPLILWCDEMEKGVGGVASSANTDSGVTLGMVGHLLTWLQEHTSDIITVMTCLSGDSLLQTASGKIVRISQYQDDFGVAIPGGISQERLIVNGMRSTITVQTSISPLRCTPNHIVLTAGNDHIREIAASDLKPNDLIACAPFLPHGADGKANRLLTPVPHVNRSPHVTQPTHVGRELAWLVGYLLGDGSIRPRADKKRFGRITWTDADEALAQAAALELSTMFSHKARVFKRKNIEAYIGYLDSAVAADLLKVNFPEAFEPGAHNKSVPAKIQELNAYGVAAFLAGLIDAEASISKSVAIHMTSEAVIRQSMLLLRRFGILSRYGTRTPRASKVNRHQVHTISITDRDSIQLLNEWVGQFMMSAKKKAALAALANRPPSCQQATGTRVFPSLTGVIRQSLMSAGYEPQTVLPLWNSAVNYGRISNLTRQVWTTILKSLYCFPVALNDAWGYAWATVESISANAEPELVYDLVLPADPHLFYANGIAVHNCNKYKLLPAELTRAGRIDERFFVDIPGLSEREEIAAVHLRKYEVPDPACAALVAGLSDGWTGAEIEQLVRSAARRTRRAITQDSLVTCAADIKPISKVRAGEITALRDWGKANLRMANTPEVAAPIGRRIGKAAR